MSSYCEKEKKKICRPKKERKRKEKNTKQNTKIKEKIIIPFYFSVLIIFFEKLKPSFRCSFCANEKGNSNLD